MLAQRHAHHAVQLVWAAGADIELTIAGHTRHVRSALIPSHTEHSLDATGRRIALLLVEAHGPRGAALDRRARDHTSIDLASISFVEDASVCEHA